MPQNGVPARSGARILFPFAASEITVTISSIRLVVWSLLAISLGVQAQTYRWVDQNGRVHYTDTPPPASAVKSEEKNLKGNVASSGDLPYAAQEAMKNFPVKLYTRAECAPCDDGRKLLDKRGIPFREIIVGDDATRAELKKLNESGRLPVLTVGNDVRKGYDAEMWNKALDIAGYPATSVPGAKVPKAAGGKPEEEAQTPKGPYATQ